MDEAWEFVGWVRQGEESQPPVSSAVIRHLIDTGLLQPTDAVRKCFRRNARTMFSSPIQAMHVHDDNSSP